MLWLIAPKMAAVAFPYLEGRLTDNYSVGRELGNGGYSTVREGVDLKSGKLVALKILKQTA